jgi:hypothetical protein
MSHMTYRRRAAAAALFAVVVAVVGCTAGPAVSPSAATPGASAPASVVPSAASSGDTIGGTCPVTDIVASAGGWEAAAGSRGAEVTVENRGSAACTLPKGPLVAILDRTANILLASPASGTGTGPTLEPSGKTGFTILFSNWCDMSVAPPLTVVLRVGSGAVEITGLSLTATDLPPCNGPGQPANLTTTTWT